MRIADWDKSAADAAYKEQVERANQAQKEWEAQQQRLFALRGQQVGSCGLMALWGAAVLQCFPAKREVEARALLCGQTGVCKRCPCLLQVQLCHAASIGFLQGLLDYSHMARAAAPRPRGRGRGGRAAGRIVVRTMPEDLPEYEYEFDDEEDEDEDERRIQYQDDSEGDADMDGDMLGSGSGRSE